MSQDTVNENHGEVGPTVNIRTSNLVHENHARSCLYVHSTGHHSLIPPLMAP